jgi:hypothetical protein
MMLQTSQQYDNSQIQQLATVIMGLRNDRGVEMNPVWFIIIHSDLKYLLLSIHLMFR